MDTRSQSPSRGPEDQWQKQNISLLVSYDRVSLSSPGQQTIPSVRGPSSSELSLCHPHYTASTLWSEKALAIMCHGTQSMARFERTSHSTSIPPQVMYGSPS